MGQHGCLVTVLGMVGFVAAGIYFGSWILIYFAIFFPVVVWLANDIDPRR